MTRLNELDLLSPAPYPLARVGHVIAPTLRQVAALGYETYNAYLSLLSLHAEQLFAASGLPDPGGANAFHTLIGNQELRALLCAAFSFFLVEDAVFSQAHSALLCMAEGHPVGIIHEANYEDVCDCILQRNHVDSAQPNRKQFRNDKAREIYEKLQRAKKKSPQQAKEKQADASLPNLSAEAEQFQAKLNRLRESLDGLSSVQGLISLGGKLSAASSGSAGNEMFACAA